MKDKEWLKEELKYFQEGENMFTDEFNVGVEQTVEYVIELLDQLDEPQKPIIPYFVAYYIEKYKGRGLLLASWLDFNYIDDFERDTEEWLYSGSYEESLRREYLLVDAIRYGYEVE